MPKSDEILRKAIEGFGDEIVEIATNLIKNEPKVNTGRLRDSLSRRVIDTAFGTRFTLQIFAEDYFVYVDKGRKPNSTPPPVEPIKVWCRQKGIDEGIAYAIAKSIGKKGIPATNISERMMKKVFSSMAWRKFEGAATSYVDDLVLNSLIGVSKKGNLTFK
jgi:hypothetical protein